MVATIAGIIIGLIILAGAIAGARSPKKYRKPTPDAVIESRRPTATRVVAGAVLGGPIGAAVGFAAQKKTKQGVYIKK